MQNIRVLFQYFQSVHGNFASIPSIRRNKTQSFDWASLYQVSLDNMVDPRGVEPLSESRIARASPSAVYVLTFPPSNSHRQDSDFSSFIKSHRPQSLRRLVPCLYHAGGLRRRRLRVDVRRLSCCEFYVFVGVSSF